MRHGVLQARYADICVNEEHLNGNSNRSFLFQRLHNVNYRHCRMTEKGMTARGKVDELVFIIKYQ